jgi:two-component system sensor histidine kinase QseC
MLAALPLLGLVAAWAVHRGVLPLRRLSQLLSERAPQALDEVVLPDATTEMAPMLHALNRLFVRIGTLMESERRFTADAAHELRTPIAAIRTQAQVALAETDDALRRHALRATLQGCDRAARLVDQLLTLSRLEAQAPAPTGPPADLAALVRQAVADAAPAALAKQQQLELVAGLPCPVHADSTLLAALARNLVDNAIRYSPSEATIRVTVALHEGHARLQVQDSGPGLADAEVQRLGERFFRVLGTGESGSGLGWSIVRRIAAVQGAQVQVSSSAELGGLHVEVRWPA